MSNTSRVIALVFRLKISERLLDHGRWWRECQPRMESRADVSWLSIMALAARAVVGFAIGAALLLINAHGSPESSQFLSHGEATF